jgi:hypothetical protein
MLLWLENQVEMGEPSRAIVELCLGYFQAVRIPRRLSRKSD